MKTLLALLTLTTLFIATPVLAELPIQSMNKGSFGRAIYDDPTVDIYVYKARSINNGTELNILTEYGTFIINKNKCIVKWVDNNGFITFGTAQWLESYDGVYALFLDFDGINFEIKLF